MTLLLMAAGRGSRYGKLKQFDELGPNGEFLMEFSMYDAIASGFENIVVITQKSNVDFLKKHLQDRLPKNTTLHVIPQEMSDLPEGLEYQNNREKPWGTAHAVWSARKVINDPFVVINADDYYGKTAYKKAAEFIRENQDADYYALAGYILKETLSEYGSVSRGVCTMDANQNLLSVNERIKIIEKQEGGIYDEDSGLKFSGDELASMNFWVCRPSIFKVIEKDLRTFITETDDTSVGEVYLPFVIQDMLQEGTVRVKVIPSGGEWFGVTYASDKEKSVKALKEMTAEGEYPSPLWS